MTAFLTDFLISIVPTFVVSRLLVWITKRWSHSLVRLAVVHCGALALCVPAGTWIFVGNATEAALVAVALFVPGQLAWFLIDAFRLVLRRRREGR